MLRRGVVLLLLAGCAERVPEEERTAATRSSIIDGRTSGEDENASVAISTSNSSCSGRLLAPRLVVAARHCFLKTPPARMNCDADGKPLETAPVDMTTAPLETIQVLVGSHKPEMRSIAVTEVLVQIESSFCRGDLAFAVLAEPALDIRTPLRRAPVTIGETISVSGWGFTNDVDRGRDKLPATRSALDQIIVRDVGPGLMPAGTFAVGGGTLCFGDSGAVALIGGAAVGVYSRIDSGGTDCIPKSARNLFQDLTSQTQLVERAYDAIGEKPTYVDDPEEVDASVPPPTSPSADAGPAPAATAPAPNAPSSSCAMRGTSTAACEWSWLVALAVAALIARKR